MTARYDLLITSMREAANTVTVIAGLALAIPVVRWTIRFAPGSLRAWIQNLFDLWLVIAMLILFVIAK